MFQAAAKMLPLQIIFFTLLVPLSSCADPINQVCEQNNNDKNLQQTIGKYLDILAAQTPARGYAVGAFGTASLTVYAVGRCRGDISSPTCSTCITSAIKGIRDSCPAATAGIVWKELCSVRFGLENFLALVDTTGTKGWASTRKAADPTKFNAAVERLMSWVVAGVGERPNRFGMGKMNFMGVMIYAVAYCSPDLQGSSCTACLGTLLKRMIGCAGRVGCVLICNSCSIRREIFPFLQTQNIPEYKGNTVTASPVA